MRRFLLIAGLVFLAMTGFSQVPKLDSAFGTNGRTSTGIANIDDFAKAIAVQRDGKIVVAGSVVAGPYGDFVVVRYNANGTLDSTFDGDGKVRTPIGAFDDRANALAIQRDGKIVVAGYSVGASGSGDFALVRYNTDGSLDSSFDNDGKLTTSLGPGAQVNAIAMQKDGKIVVTGFCYVNNAPDFALARYNPDGSLDVSFDGDGKLTTPITQFDRANAIAIQKDGKIVVGGYTNSSGSTSQFAVIRYYPDGRLDNGFDGDGKVITDVQPNLTSNITSIAIQPDGKIIAAGYTFTSTGTNVDFAIVRYNTNGSRDSSFDGDGIVITPVAAGHNDDLANAVAIQTDGKIVAGGYSYNGDNQNFALVRYNRNGSLDSTFNGNGKASFDLFGKVDYASCMALSSKRIYLAGYKATEPGGSTDFAIASFINDSYLLPFQVIDFSGRLVNNNAFLKWTTENELNTFEFIVERSTDDRNYILLGTVASINATDIYEHQFDDLRIPLSGASVIYYRLGVKDINGQLIYSRVIALPLDRNNNSVLLYPNPVVNDANLLVTSDRADRVRCRIIDNLGRIMQQQQLDLQPGTTSIPIDARRLASGVYFLDLRGKYFNRQTKFVK